MKHKKAALSKVHHSQILLSSELFECAYFIRFYIYGHSYLVADDDSEFGSLFWTIDRFFFILGSGMIKISYKNPLD